MESGLLPLAAIERRVVPRVARHLAQTRENRRLAQGGRHRLAPREPVTRTGSRQIIGVKARREGPLFHGVHAPGEWLGWRRPRGQCTRTAAAGIVSGLNSSRKPVAGIAIRMDTGEHPDIGDPAIMEELRQQSRHVGGPVERIERAAETLGVAGLERRRQRKPQLAATGGVGCVMGADHRRRLAHRRPQPAQRVAHEDLRAHVALGGAALLHRRQRPLRRARQRTAPTRLPCRLVARARA